MFASISIALFGASLATIVGLFGLRAYEESRGVYFFGGWRSRLDAYARAFKLRLMYMRHSLKHFPAISFLILRYFIHVGAKAFARFARRMEEGAYAVADMVSHKHRFERRKSKSQFLHQVANDKEERGQQSEE